MNVLCQRQRVVIALIVTSVFAGHAAMTAGSALAQSPAPGTREALPTTVSPEQFGAVGDCVADDTAALVAMRDALRATQDARPGEAVTLTMRFPPGKCYRYTNNRWTWGLKRLEVLGNGSTFQNVASARTGPWTTFGAYVFISNRGPFSNLTTLDSNDRSGSPGTDYGQLIESTRAGERSVRLKDAAEAQKFAAGQSVMVHSYDQQIMTSWPPNARYFDYARITRVDRAAGRIELTRPLEHRHSDRYPEVPVDYYDPPQPRTGRARIVRLGTEAVPFAETLLLKDMRFLFNPNARRNDAEDEYLYKAHNYILIQGVHSARLENVVAGTFVPSHAASVRVSDSHFYMAEVDKLLGTLEITNSVFEVVFSACTGANRVSFRGGVIGGPKQAESKTYKITAVTCVPRRATFERVTFNSPFQTNPYLPTYTLNNYHPIHRLEIAGSTFNGGGPPQKPIGSIPPLRLAITGGSGPRTTAVPNRVRFSAYTRFNTPGSNAQHFLRCTEIGGEIGLVKKGAKTELLGTLRDISGEGNDAILDIDIAATVEDGDTIACHPVRRGGVVLRDNTYNNYGSGPDIRY